MSLDSIDRLVVFGASYCQTSLGGRFSEPTLNNPFGSDVQDTYNEPGKPNWVMHFQAKKPGVPMLVYNYAYGGATTDGLVSQVNAYLQSPQAAADRRSALACLWIGINDCCFAIDPVDVVNRLFTKAVDTLIESGLRRFVLFEVPPRMRKPKPLFVSSPGYERHHSRIKTWNIALAQQALTRNMRDVALDIRIFPSWHLFTDLMDNAAQYGIDALDAGKARGGAIWLDGLHPTSLVHGMVADKLTEVLSHDKQVSEAGSEPEKELQQS